MSRMRRDFEVGFSQLGWHVFRSRVFHHFPELGAESVAPVHDRRDDQLAHQVPVPDRGLQRNARSVAVAVEIGSLDLEVAEERCGVVRRLLETERPVDIGGVSVALLLEGDHSPGFCEGVENMSERGVDCRPAAMQQQQRRACTVHFVVQVEPVHRSVTTLLFHRCDTKSARRSSIWLQPCSIPARYCGACAVAFITFACSVSLVLLPCSLKTKVFRISNSGAPWPSNATLVKTRRSGGTTS